MRQVWRALGEDQDRVDRVWVTRPGEPAVAEVTSADPALRVLGEDTVDPAALAVWLNAMGARREGDILLLDPLGTGCSATPRALSQ